MKYPNKHGKRQRRGTALVEAVLALPLLMVILGLVWWVGWAMTNQQRVKSAAHYAAWRGAYGDGVTEAEIERVEFVGKGTVREYTLGGGPRETIDELVDVAALASPQAAHLADRGPRARYRKGNFVRLSGEFPTSVGLWNRYQGDIRSRAGREGPTWRHRDAAIRDAILEMYFPELDTRMRSVPRPGDGMAEMVRDLYISGW
ncbi:MAG: pilus assembly protein [Phycisphaerae bacterium]|nr:pilus assembly protein [Phycisphaerae bacterium]